MVSMPPSTLSLEVDFIKGIINSKTISISLLTCFLIWLHANKDHFHFKKNLSSSNVYSFNHSTYQLLVYSLNNYLIFLLYSVLWKTFSHWSIWRFEVRVTVNCVLLMRMLGTEHWPAAREVRTLNCWTIFSNLGFICLWFIFSINFKCVNIRYMGYIYVNFTHVDIYCKLHYKH